MRTARFGHVICEGTRSIRKRTSWTRTRHGLGKAVISRLLFPTDDNQGLTILDVLNERLELVELLAAIIPPARHDLAPGHRCCRRRRASSSSSARGELPLLVGACFSSVLFTGRVVQVLRGCAARVARRSSLVSGGRGSRGVGARSSAGAVAFIGR